MRVLPMVSVVVGLLMVLLGEVVVVAAASVTREGGPLPPCFFRVGLQKPNLVVAVNLSESTQGNHVLMRLPFPLVTVGSPGIKLNTECNAPLFLVNMKQESFEVIKVDWEKGSTQKVAEVPRKQYTFWYGLAYYSPKSLLFVVAGDSSNGTITTNTQFIIIDGTTGQYTSRPINGFYHGETGLQGTIAGSWYIFSHSGDEVLIYDIPSGGMIYLTLFPTLDKALGGLQYDSMQQITYGVHQFAPLRSEVIAISNLGYTSKPSRPFESQTGEVLSGLLDSTYRYYYVLFHVDPIVQPSYNVLNVVDISNGPSQTKVVASTLWFNKTDMLAVF